MGIHLALKIWAFLSMAVAALPECPQQLIFLPQTHPPYIWSGEDFTPADYDRVAESQLKINRFIETHPGLAVFSENSGGIDFTLAGISAREREQWERERTLLNPEPFPQSFDQLHGLLKQKFVSGGGDFVALMRGLVTVVHKVFSAPMALTKTLWPVDQWLKSRPTKNTPYPPAIAHIVYGVREVAALEQVQMYFQNHAEAKAAILIFGKNHNFSFYKDQFRPDCVAVPENFQDDWNGKKRIGPDGF